MDFTEEYIGTKKTGGATISMICGITSLVGSCMLGPLNIPIALVGLVLGLMSLKSADKGYAITGIITSFIALIIAVIMIVALTEFISEKRREEVFTIEPAIAEPPPEYFDDRETGHEDH